MIKFDFVIFIKQLIIYLNLNYNMLFKYKYKHFTLFNYGKLKRTARTGYDRTLLNNNFFYDFGAIFY